MSKYLWILDAGHGGVIDGVAQTAGKRSPVWEDGSQLFEGVFNRQVMEALICMLDDAGISWVSNTRGPRDVPLRERTDFANEEYRKARLTGGRKRVRPILVSIHADAFSRESANGWTIYTSKGETKSDRIADVFYCVADEMLPDFRMRMDTSDGDADKEENFWMLRKSVMPAVLTENLFMTNRRECKFLMSDEGVKRIAALHFEAIRRIEESNKRYA